MMSSGLNVQKRLRSMKKLTINVRRIWQYSLGVAVLMFIIGIATDSRDVERYASQMERLMAQGEYQKALEVGARSDKTDKRLMTLRIQALAHEKLLGERLFAYPIAGKGKDFASQGGDHALCAALIDKDLDRFVELLPKYYRIDDKLPRYYREALILYNHLRSNPRILYHDSVMDTDYSDLQELEKKYPEPKARQMAVFNQYEGTYWYYYDYIL